VAFVFSPAPTDVIAQRPYGYVITNRGNIMNVIGHIQVRGKKLAVVKQHARGFTRYDCVSEEGEPYGTLSKILPGTPLGPGEVLIKTYAENESYRQPLLDAGLFEDTGKRVPSGFIELEVWRRKH
jgi:hypothetical protein